MEQACIDAVTWWDQPVDVVPLPDKQLVCNRKRKPDHEQKDRGASNSHQDSPCSKRQKQTSHEKFIRDFAHIETSDVKLGEQQNRNINTQIVVSFYY